VTGILHQIFSFINGSVTIVAVENHYTF